MHLLKNRFFSGYYTDKSAFILNANAKSVTDRVVSRLVDLIPAGDLFYSRSLQESENFYRTILTRGYARVFSGGGDGTLVNAINTIRRLSKNEPSNPIPAIGVLKLGTGNAMASIVGAQSPWIDVNHVVKGGMITTRPMNLVECDNGELAPFAGIGYDGEILNDYFALKEKHRGKPTERLMHSVFGYLWVGMTRTIPRNLNHPQSWIRAISQFDACKIICSQGKDQEHFIPAGSILYEGPSCLVSVGSIPYFGYNFKMFPFAGKKQGHIQLRICSSGLTPMITHLYPGLWKGTYRHPKLHDFLVKDVQIECNKEMPYQIGGDAAGLRHSLSFKATESIVKVVELSKQRLVAPRGMLGLLPAPIFARD
jgi:diacylglycerol kinase family enzyme